MNDPETLREAAALILSGHPAHPSRMLDFGLDLVSLFNLSGELEDVESAIAILRQVLELDYEGIQTRFGLGTALNSRYERLGKVNDIAEAVGFLRYCKEFSRADDEERTTILMTLSRALRNKFGRTGEIGDLEDAISYGQESFDCATDDSERIAALYSLAHAYQARFRRFGEIDDIGHQISSLERAIELAPDDDFDKGTYLSSLSVVLKQRFERLGDQRDLHRAIDTLRDAISLCPNGHPERPTLLNNFGSALLTRFLSIGSEEDLNSSITYLSEAEELMLDDHVLKSRLLSNLAIAFQNRFERYGDLIDISRAIEIMQNAVARIEEGHADKAMFVKTLGLAYRARYRQLEQLPDIELSVSYLRQAVGLTPKDHADRAHRLNDLCIALLHRLDSLAEEDDLDLAVSFQEEAVSLTREGDIEKAIRLNNLGMALRTRSAHSQHTDIEMLRRALACHRSAVELTSDMDKRKPVLLSNLAAAHSVLFRALGDDTHLEDALRALELSLEIDEGHADDARLFNNNAVLLLYRYQQAGRQQDVERAMTLCRRGLEHAPVGNIRAKILINLAYTHRSVFERERQSSDFDAAVDAFRAATNETTAFAWQRLYAARVWADMFEDFDDPTDGVIEAHDHAIHLISQFIWLGQQLETRYDRAENMAVVVSKAVSAAIRLGRLELAVEWLEAGRSQIWGQILQLRTPLDELEKMHPQLASRFRELSKALETTGVSFQAAINSTSEPAILDAQTPTSGEEAAAKRRNMATQYDTLLEEIRSMDGFYDFLRPKSFSALRHAARDGPIVILSVAKARCDALILHPAGNIVHVPLPSLTQDLAVKMRNNFSTFLRASGVIRGREAEPDLRATVAPHSSQRGGGMENVLRLLWLRVVQPVLQAIQGRASDIFSP